jgi:hypothetical protein
MDGREMLVWGDILTGHPELIDRLPDGVTVVEWGYEANHAFDKNVGALAASGRPAWVSPGTSAWNSLFGRTTNMRENQVAAAEAARAHSAVGWLNTDWGDDGHLQYVPASWPGFAHGAATSWCLDTNRDVDLALDDTMAALLALGDLHRVAERQTPNLASFILPIWYPHLRRAFVTDDELDAVAAGLEAGRAAMATGDHEELARAEVVNSIALAEIAVDDGRARNAAGGPLPDIDERTRHDLADRLDVIIDEHRRLWLARNRPGGLSDSVSRLERLADSYRAGAVDADWLPPGLRPVDAEI